LTQSKKSGKWKTTIVDTLCHEMVIYHLTDLSDDAKYHHHSWCFWLLSLLTWDAKSKDARQPPPHSSLVLLLSLDLVIFSNIGSCSFFRETIQSWGCCRNRILLACFDLFYFHSLPADTEDSPDGTVVEAFALFYVPVQQIP
jgi:hypothetical protein